MTLKEAKKRFGIPIEKLEEYVSLGFLRRMGSPDNPPVYKDDDLEKLGLIDTLFSAGFTSEDIKKYLVLSENVGSEPQQIRMLRKQRCSLLNDIHQRQQTLDKLDYLIRNNGGK